MNHPNLIAECGSVHDGSFGNAQCLIKLAKLSGAHSVKFQVHCAKHESLDNAPNPAYFTDESRIEYFNRTSFTLEQWKQLKNYAEQLDIAFLASPFSLEAVDILEEIEIDAYKIPSGEVTNIPLLDKVADLGKPVYLSSGMSNWEELDLAVSSFKDKCNLVVMQCSSMYPCSPERVGLNIIPEIAKRYNVPVGFSDHTLGYSAPLAAATLGASVIEKHFTFSRSMYGSDARHSMEPLEFKVMANSLDEIWRMLTTAIDKDDLNPYLEIKKIFQKSIVAASPISKGSVINSSQLAYKKPGIGLPPKYYTQIIGKTAMKDILQNEFISIGDFQ